jgi:hypothetical protein
MSDIKSYHDLEVWKRGRKLVTATYALTHHFPKHEIYGLSSQMQRIFPPYCLSPSAYRLSLKTPLPPAGEVGRGCPTYCNAFIIAPSPYPLPQAGGELIEIPFSPMPYLCA